MRAKQRKRWDVIIDRLDKTRKLVGAEVGVREGKTSEPLLKTFPYLHLYCVDAWMPADPGSTYELSGALDARDSEQKHIAVMKRFLNRVAPYADRVTVLRGDFVDVCSDVPDELDFVFLDADHSEDGTYVALSTYAPKVKRGGWIFLHDLGAGSKYDGPELAAKEYFGDTFDFGEYADDHTWVYHVIGRE